jgi:protein ImuA
MIPTMLPDFATIFPLRPGRVHEACGPGAAAFAVMAAGQGRAIWIRPAWQKEGLYPVGILSVSEPCQMLIARTEHEVDSLAVAEEALRDGALSFVLIEITRPLDLREGRRLQLAAKAGGTTGLCLIPEGMGSNAAETRWRVRPVFDDEREDSTLMRWEIIKNKSGTIGAWNVRWSQEARRVHVVSPVGLRPGSEGAPG